jgi:hypothetical protein
VISNSYGSPNLAGLLRTLTPKRDTTDILKVVYRAGIRILAECNEEGSSVFMYNQLFSCLRLEKLKEVGGCGVFLEGRAVVAL